MASSSSEKPSSNRSFTGINHLKLSSFNILATQKFYTEVLHFTPLPHFNHYTPDHKLFAVMFEHKPTKLIIEARYHPKYAEAERGWDPVTWGVGKRQDLEQWARWFDGNGVRRSEILTGIKSWVMAAEDPDGKVVRLYVEDEEHEWTDNPSQDAKWLGEIMADPNADGVV